jgi:hypothetical protein
MYFWAVLISSFVNGNKWTSQGKIDRAMLLLNGTNFSENLILWQNTQECHHCSWIRSRDIEGNFILALKENVSVIAWIDVRWPQKFRFATVDSNTTDYQGYFN